ncbi:hypothetical protein EVB39_029 [Rhizobium phage RHph_TM3_3_9]|nr:hypothetical protein EVB39_029 [Rhizobium phage RHph_TM3_3_9]QIG68550.1 hypothetical protein EVB66_029 [Rhizobium phage RHph_TM3_3_13]QIG74408.1 hypothetical protein EVC09_028 [Rhizobium phage RHph_TM3_3_10]QXV74522.1 hypothetical protein [Rhizobium phage RHEph19]
MTNPFEWIKAAAYGALGLLVTVLYYEGLPGFSRIPFLTSVPVIGDLTAGAKHVYADAQVKAATDKLISDARRAAAEALAEKIRREDQQRREAAAEERAQVEAARLKELDEHDRYGKAIADDDTDDGPRVTDSDVEWLRKHSR